MTIIDLFSILPVIVLLVWALFLLMADLWLSKHKPGWTLCWRWLVCCFLWLHPFSRLEKTSPGLAASSWWMALAISCSRCLP